MKRRYTLSRTTRRWMAAFALVWAVSCTMVWLAAPAYLILQFLLFQLLVFPALMIGLCASACWHADLGTLPLGAAGGAGRPVQHLAAEYAVCLPTCPAESLLCALRPGGIPAGDGGGHDCPEDPRPEQHRRPVRSAPFAPAERPGLLL